MKSAIQWSEELNGETTPQAIKQIQQEAVAYAAEIAKNVLWEGGHYEEGRNVSRAILDSIEKLSLHGHNR